MKKESSSEIMSEREYLVHSSQAEEGNAGGFETTWSLQKLSKSSHCGGESNTSFGIKA